LVVRLLIGGSLFEKGAGGSERRAFREDMKPSVREVMALIPARSGSERIKDKNIAALGGRPLIAYSIEAARGSRWITRVVVSTDSDAIAGVAEKAGAEVPFLRPKEISSSTSTELEFFLHALEWLKTREDYSPEIIVELFPTAPFRRSETIDRAIQMMFDHPEADSLRSVKLCSEHPYKMWEIDGRGYLRPLFKKDDTNVQTLAYKLLPKIYVQNANIYITKPETIFSKGSPVGDVVIPFIMSEEESVDINTPLDLFVAEAMLHRPT